MHVLIIGAGIGGLSLAQSLRKQGVSYEIFERDTHHEARFQGCIIDAISSSFPADLPDLKASVTHFRPLDLPCQIAIYLPGNVKRIGFEESPKLPLIRAERQRLRDWLATSLPIQWGKRITNIALDPEGVEAQFEDGSIARGDILVGADGINSLVRTQLLQRPSADLLKVVPLATIVGELTLSGDAFRRQLALGTSAYMCIRPDLGFVCFVGLHYVNSDGHSAQYYWNFMKTDPEVGKPDHWLQNATKQDKLSFVLSHVTRMQPELYDIFQSTPVEGIMEQSRVWRDLELESLPAGRVVLIGDAAHAMTPFRGEGAVHTLIDTLLLGKVVGNLAQDEGWKSEAGIAEAIDTFNRGMLQRAVQAVQDSRNLRANAQRSGPDGNPIFVPMEPLTEIKVKLGNATSCNSMSS